MSWDDDFPDDQGQPGPPYQQPGRGPQQQFPNDPSQRFAQPGQQPGYPQQQFPNQHTGQQQAFPNQYGGQQPAPPQQQFPNHHTGQQPTHPAQQPFPNHPTGQQHVFPNPNTGAQPVQGGQQPFANPSAQNSPGFQTGAQSVPDFSSRNVAGAPPGQPLPAGRRPDAPFEITTQIRIMYASSGATAGALIGLFLGIVNTAMEDQELNDGMILTFQMVVWFALFIGILAAWRPDRFDNVKRRISTALGLDEDESGDDEASPG